MSAGFSENERPVLSSFSVRIPGLAEVVTLGASTPTSRPDQDQGLAYEATPHRGMVRRHGSGCRVQLIHCN